MDANVVWGFGAWMLFYSDYYVRVGSNKVACIFYCTMSN